MRKGRVLSCLSLHPDSHNLNDLYRLDIPQILPSPVPGDGGRESGTFLKSL